MTLNNSFPSGFKRVPPEPLEAPRLEDQTHVRCPKCRMPSRFILDPSPGILLGAPLLYVGTYLVSECCRAIVAELLRVHPLDEDKSK